MTHWSMFSEEDQRDQYFLTIKFKVKMIQSKTYSNKDTVAFLFMNHHQIKISKPHLLMMYHHC